jgi:hypothetical protein
MWMRELPKTTNRKLSLRTLLTELPPPGRRFLQSTIELTFLSFQRTDTLDAQICHGVVTQNCGKTMHEGLEQGDFAKVRKASKRRRAF